ncbi:hypothetical protein DB32_002705 [Sandaracinus amylolyticus]|uniref:Uncharacterized protein n=1 Tax=Sandaracinus amylolyticus TaxID=927083 RepID=A0A0F6W256_9BACT|nr:hypothetical protein DB32_002705 [Sandaracinus amylolyticus]
MIRRESPRLPAPSGSQLVVPVEPRPPLEQPACHSRHRPLDHEITEKIGTKEELGAADRNVRLPALRPSTATACYAVTLPFRCSRPHAQAPRNSPVRALSRVTEASPE